MLVFWDVTSSSKDVCWDSVPKGFSTQPVARCNCENLDCVVGSARDPGWHGVRVLLQCVERKRRVKGEGGTFSRLYTKALRCWPVEPSPFSCRDASAGPHCLPSPGPRPTEPSSAWSGAVLLSRPTAALACPESPQHCLCFSVPVWRSPLQGVLRLRSQVISSLLHPRNSSAPPPPWRLCPTHRCTLLLIQQQGVRDQGRPSWPLASRGVFWCLPISPAPFCHLSVGGPRARGFPLCLGPLVPVTALNAG